jgi:peptidoglycan-associated lipoprotein
MRIAAIVAGIGLLLGGWACSSRQVTSGSGDQSTATRDKTAVETVQQPPVAAVHSSENQAASVSSAPSGVEPPVPDTRASRFTPSAPSSTLPPQSASADLSGLGDIFFDFDRYNLRSDSEAVLQGNATWLRHEPSKSFLIEGHCDERGTLAYNLVLGEKRARATKRYLEELGIPASRMYTTSYGEVRPFCKDHNEGCWQQNRRAHFVVQ